MSDTKEKWVVEPYISPPDKYRIIGENGELILSDGKVSAFKDKDLLEYICQCINGWDEQVKKIKELESFITKTRPYADCYRAVCKVLGIENNILDFVKRLQISHDNLLAACEFAAAPEAPFRTDQLEFANNIIEAIAKKAKAAIAAAKDS